jgi:hypothetical protein
MCLFQADYEPSVDHLPSRQGTALLCVDPLPHSGSARFGVRLYW